MSALKHLFQPIVVGNMHVKNRLVMSPMGINFGVDEEGNVTEQLGEYFAARARGGTGMLIVGGGGVHPLGLDLPRLPPLWDDKYIPALKKFVDTVHRSSDGVKLGMQLLHGGRQVSMPSELGRVAPSPIPAIAVVDKEIPKELTLDEIKEVIDAYAESARRCMEAGFDFVEIHAAHGYLIGEFMAPISNKRQDKYGGSHKNRVRFLLECFAAIREKTSADFPVGVRFNGSDYVENGWTLDDSRRLAPMLEERGAAYLHVSTGIYGTLPPAPITIPSMYAPQGCIVDLAAAVKKEVSSIPVITVCRIKDPVMADQIIKEGKADMVAMGRAHLADPELANKAQSGRISEIRPCIACCIGCIGNLFLLQECSCVMNPEVNREYILKNRAEIASITRKVLVVGAGPAGLAAARLLALRGHHVIICEERGYLGGMLRIASIPPGRAELMELIQYYQRELNRLHVEIRLNTKLSNELIDEIKPEVAVLATGSLPDIPHVDEGLFDTDMEMHTVVDILERNAVTGDRVIVLGGNQIGLEVADYLAEKGKEVVVLHRGKHYAEEMAANDRTYLIHRVLQEGIQRYKDVSIEKVTKNGVIFKSKGKENCIEGFDDVVMAEGMWSNREPANLFKGKNIEVHIIGDAKTPATLLESQAQADEVGRSI